MFLKKTKEEVLRKGLEVIVENTPVTNLNAGSIARSILEATSGEFESLYEVAEFVLNQGFLSRAEGEYLDLFGVMFNYPRRTEVVINEETGIHEEQEIDDETYRYELSRQVQVAVSSNEEAVRLTALQVPGVQDVTGKEYSHGTGSFSFILTVQNGFDEELVKQEVENAVYEMKAYGVKSEILLPKNMPLEISLSLVLKEDILEVDAIRNRVQTNLMNYFGNFDTGQEFIYNDFVQEVMNADENIIDFRVNSFRLNDQPALLTNHTVLEEERISPRLIEVL